MQLFYHKSISDQDHRVEFDKDESRHIVKVLRHNKGDILHVTNGLGNIFKVELIDVSPKFCTGQIIEKEQQPPLPYYLHIAIAPTKNNDRLEWFLEKATELGISEITPIICDHSERKVVKPDRLFKIIESAVKQSLSAYMPKLNDPISFKEFLTSTTQLDAYKCLAHCYEGEKPLFFQRIADNDRVLVLIGPEGDFSIEEVEQAQKSGFEAVSLGSRRLRTETAGVYACAQMAAVKEK